MLPDRPCQSFLQAVLSRAFLLPGTGSGGRGLLFGMCSIIRSISTICQPLTLPSGPRARKADASTLNEETNQRKAAQYNSQSVLNGLLLCAGGDVFFARPLFPIQITDGSGLSQSCVWTSNRCVCKTRHSLEKLSRISGCYRCRKVTSSPLGKDYSVLRAVCKAPPLICAVPCRMPGRCPAPPYGVFRTRFPVEPDIFMLPVIVERESLDRTTKALQDTQKGCVSSCMPIKVYYLHAAFNVTEPVIPLPQAGGEASSFA